MPEMDFSNFFTSNVIKQGQTSRHSDMDHCNANVPSNEAISPATTMMMGSIYQDQDNKEQQRHQKKPKKKAK